MEDLLPLLAIAAYWIIRAVRGSNKKKGARPAAPVATGKKAVKKAPTPFEQLMAQLESALEEPNAEPSDSAAAVPPPRPVERQAERPPAPRAMPKPPRAVPIGFDSSDTGDTGGFDHDRHGFGRENPLSEEVFESRPRFAPRPATQARPRYDPHDLKRAPAPPPRRRAVSWAERLRDPAAAREALVLKTIFEGPWTPRTGRLGK